jgi:preprotein translocase subunit SecB
MADAPKSPNAPAGAAPSAVEAARLAPVTVRAQYLKDLSFENPAAPQSLMQMNQAPNVQINVNVEAKKLSDKDYEVTLHIRGEAKQGETILFLVEVAYAGIFFLDNMADNLIQPILLIEAPRLLFPFARTIVAEATREGGFPPLLIQPVDFVALYQQHMAQAKATAPGGTA